MNTNALVIANALSDRDLLARLEVLALSEREASVELVAHLAVLDVRPSLYAAEGYSSVFAYCTQALRLSEDAASNRIAAARACRKFPVVLELLASGDLSLSAIRSLGPHLTQTNHEAVLARARGRSRREIDVLVAELDPQPDARAMVRKLPTPRGVDALPPAPTPPAAPPAEPPPPAPQPESAGLPPPPASAPQVFLPAPPSSVKPTAPERYRVQLTIASETHEKFRKVQALLRREIPNGDPAAIFDRAITLLLAKVEKAKCGAGAAVIRPGADTDEAPGWRAARTIPRWIRRHVWSRDGGRCAFVSHAGHRCGEQHFLDYHHRIPRALGGPNSVDNISLRCRRHNQHEADLVFGARSIPPRHAASETQQAT
jgi:hypothetical protein